MRPHERLVGQVETRWPHAAGDHVRAAVEEVLVVAVERAAISEDQAGLALAPSAAAALGVIGRRRRHVAQVNQVEVGDVHAQFHRGRAHQVGQPTTQLGFLPRVAVFPAETALAPFAFAGLDHLRRVLAGLERRQRGGRLAVEPLEEGVHRGRRRRSRGRRATGIHRVKGRRAAVAQSPEQAGGVELEELVVVDGIEPDQESLADQQREEAVEKAG